jgi:hypothetical protein
MTRPLILALALTAACGSGEVFPFDAAPPAALTTCPVGNGLFVAYDGTAPADLDRIAQAKPNFVVLGTGLEARSDLAQPLQRAGVRALVTIDTLGSTRVVDSNIETAMKAGWDGVLFDHVSASAHDYNADVANRVHGSSANKLVVMNAGQASVDANVFDHADIVSSAEHFEDALSPSGMPAWRWLSSANGAVSADDAMTRLGSYRGLGGFWFAPSSGALPDWFEDFAARVRALDAPCGPSSTLTVQSVDLDHNNAAISGLEVLISQNGAEVTHGFTPLSLLLPKGSYVVTAESFMNETFDHWDDNTRPPARAVSLSTDLSLTAYYHTVATPAVVTYQAVDMTAPTVPLMGLFVTLEDANGATLDSGFSTKPFTVNIGTSYFVVPGNFDDMVNKIDYTFVRWSDGVMTQNRVFTFSGDTTIVAYYDVVHQ